jgi:hypothetical protein
MWISKEKYDRIIERLDSQKLRIENLEERVTPLVKTRDENEFVFYSLGADWSGSRLSAKKVIEIVLDHLGLQLSMTSATPSKFLLKKKTNK